MNTMLGVLLLIVTAPPSLLLVDAATVDRGDFKAGPLLKHTFRVANTTLDTMTITALESGCGCVRRSVSKNELKPGETADVSIEVNTLTQADGPQSWQLKLKHRPASAAKSVPDDLLELRLSAKLSHEVSVSPPMISISTEAEAVTTIALTDKRATPLGISKIVSSSSHVTAKLRAPAKAGTLVIDLSVAADLPVGTHDETLVLHTTDADYAELRVPARIVKRAKNAVTAYPEALDLAAGNSSGVVQFRRGGAKPVAIASAECGTPGVNVTASAGSGPVGTIKVVVPGKASGKAEVKVKFSEPADAEIVVLVRWDGN